MLLLVWCPYPRAETTALHTTSHCMCSSQRCDFSEITPLKFERGFTSVTLRMRRKLPNAVCLGKYQAHKYKPRVFYTHTQFTRATESSSH